MCVSDYNPVNASSIRTGCWGEYLDQRGRRWWQTGKDCI